MSEEINNIIECDLKGGIVSKKGEFESMSEDVLKKITKKIVFILKDAVSLENKANLGKFKKISIKDGKNQYEVAIGSTAIKIIKVAKE